MHNALDDLENADPESAKLVKLRYFAGLTVDEAAECMGISPERQNMSGPTPEVGCGPIYPRIEGPESM